MNALNVSNKIKKLLAAFVVSTFFLTNSCTDTIVLDLGENVVKVVIEAKVENLISINKRASGGTELDTATQISVIIRKSKDFYDTNETPNVEGATVEVTDPNGNSYTVTETGSGGLYINNTVDYLPPGEYSLSVTSEGQTYTSTARLYPPKQYKNIKFKKEILNLGGVDEEETLIQATIEDTPGQRDFYRSYVVRPGGDLGPTDGSGGQIEGDGFTSTNESKNAELYIDDLGRDGETLPYSRPIVSINDQNTGVFKFSEGDNMDVYLIVFDEGAYTYVTDIEKVRNDGIGRSAPFNPRSNITGDALGYFTVNNIVVEKVSISFSQ